MLYIYIYILLNRTYSKGTVRNNWKYTCEISVKLVPSH